VVVGVVVLLLLCCVRGLWAFNTSARRKRRGPLDVATVPSGTTAAATEDTFQDGVPGRVIHSRRQGPHVRRQGSNPVAHARLVTQATARGDTAVDMVPVAIPLTREGLGRERASVAERSGVPLADAAETVEAAIISSLGGSGRVWNVVTDAEVVRSRR